MSPNELEAVKQQWRETVREFRAKFVRGHGPISNGDNYPQDAESWVEADEEELLGFIYQKIDQAITSTKQEMSNDAELVLKRLDEVFGVRDHQISKLLLRYSQLKDLQDRKVEE